MKTEWKDNIYTTIIIIALIFNGFIAFKAGYNAGMNDLAVELLLRKINQ